MATAAQLAAMARSAPFDAGAYDYRSAPLGTVAGEEGLSVPYNMSQEAVVHVRNWSALVERRIIVEAISPSRGGARSTAKGGPYAGHSAAELRQRVKDEGEDMNWYDRKIAPITFRLRFDGQVVDIRPDLEEVDVKDPATGQYHTEKQPIWHLVKPGAWDLYMGNWYRMHSPRFLERTKEMENLAARGLQKYVMMEDNPDGFLEFKREEVRYETQRVDRAKLSAAEVIEV